MPNKVILQNFYRTTVTSASAIPLSWDFNFDVAVAPVNKNWFLILGSENISTRQIFYYHDVIGNTIYVRGVNRITAASVPVPTGYSVKMNDVSEIFNYFGDNLSTLFYVEKIGGLSVKVSGWYIMYNNNQISVADTTLALTDGTTNYIKYDAPTNTISADTVASGNIKCEVVCSWGAITSILYRTSKESYLDFAISLTGALPSQGWNSGKALVTDGTNVSWGIPNGLRSWMLTAQNIWATNGSPNITVADTTGWVNGATITWTGIPGGTTISSFIPNTSAILSASFTGTTWTVSVQVGYKQLSEYDASGAEVKRPISAGTAIIGTDLIQKINPVTRAREEVTFSQFQSVLSPSALNASLDKYLIENVAVNNLVSHYNIPASSETPLGYINVGDVAWSAIQTIYDVSSGTSWNSVSFYTDKVSASSNFVIRAVTVDGSGVATTTQVHANALQSVAHASITALGVTTITFPWSFTCGVAGTKFAWQICQGTFGAPIVSGASYYKVGFNVWSSILFAENTTTMAASVAWTNTYQYCTYVVAARRISIRWFTSYVSLVWVNVSYGVIPQNLWATPVNQPPVTWFEVDMTTTTWTTHTLPNPIVLEKWESFYVKLKVAWSYNFHNHVGLTNPNADIQYLWPVSNIGYYWVFNWFLTKWVGEVERTSVLSAPSHLRKWSSDDQLLLLTQLGYASTWYNFWESPTVVLSWILASSGLTIGETYVLNNENISATRWVYKKAVWRAISSTKIVIWASSVTKKSNGVKATEALYIEGNIWYQVVTACDISISFDLKTWTVLDSSLANLYKNITLPPCFIKSSQADTIFYI